WVVVGAPRRRVLQEFPRNQMRVAGADLKLWRVGICQLSVDFLSDVSAGSPRGRPRHERAARAIQAVGRAGEPPGVIAARQLPFWRRLDPNAGPGVVNVLPSDLIGQPQLVVACRIKLIKSPPRTVGAI